MQVKVLQNAPREHSAILSTSIKLPFVVKTFVLSFYEWPLKTGFTVIHILHCCRFARLHETYSEIDVEAVNLNGK